MKGTKWRETSSWFVSNHRSAFVVSGSIACSPLCVFHHLSLTICIPYTSSVSEVICLRSYDCLSGLCPVLVSSWFHLCFVFVSVFCSLCDLCVFLLSQDENHVPPRFLACILPLVSHLSPTCLLPCLLPCLPLTVSDTNGETNNQNRVASEYVSCDSCCSRLTWINNCQRQELV